jgi:threonine dehydrogenase-like Zn-dependent dehydrogenase
MALPIPVIPVLVNPKLSPWSHENALSFYETMHMPAFPAPTKFPIVKPATDPLKLMKALEWHGNKDVRVVNRPRPIITERRDVIVQVTSATVCGSDLHLYHAEFQGLEKGDILGHEAVGFVESVGPDVLTLKVGDRVVVSAIISCGDCSFCKAGTFSLCDNTNPSTTMEALYGHRTSGIFGYSHLTGGYDGTQAEFVRVPIGDMNCLKIPLGLRDEQVLGLSDITCTGWHANVMGGVSEGNVVAVWGLGPVGLMACMWAKFRGASRVIGIDSIPERLALAKARLGIEVINFVEDDPVAMLKTIVPNPGPDVCIDCVGFRYTKTLAHATQRTTRLETDSPEVLTECIKACRKGGTISVIGDYYNVANAFPIGPFMEKGLCMRGGQLFCQSYWVDLLNYIQQGRVDPSFVFSHVFPLEQIDQAYGIFDRKEAGLIKPIIKTAAAPVPSR